MLEGREDPGPRWAPRPHARPLTRPLCSLSPACSRRLDFSWWDKLLGASFRGGRFQLRQLTGGKIDDITVLVAMVEEVPVSLLRGGVDLS